MQKGLKIARMLIMLLFIIFFSYRAGLWVTVAVMESCVLPVIMFLIIDFGMIGLLMLTMSFECGQYNEETLDE